MPQAPHPLVMLAAEAIGTFLSEQRVIEPPDTLFVGMPDARVPASVFVCLKREGELRGCVGTTEPAQGTLAKEVIENAIGSATRDPRFAPVQQSELGDLEISVDVLGSTEPVLDLSGLDHRRYGIIVRSGTRHSVLLPDIEGINSVAEQVEVARKKAGLGATDPIEIRRFEVKRYK